MLEWIWSVSSIVNKVHELDMKAVAITDYYGVYGMVDFYRTAKDLEINPIVWVELGLVDSLKVSIHQEDVSNIVLLAENKEWYDNILNLVSLAHVSLVHYKPCIDLDTLEKHKEWLFGFMGGKKSVLGAMILQWVKDDELKDYLTRLLKIFGKDKFYIEVVAQDYKREKDLKVINDRLISLSDSANIGKIVANDYHYVEKSDKEAFELALAIKDGLKLYDEERRKVAGNYHIFTEAEIIEVMEKNGFDKKSVDEMIQTTASIAEKCMLKLDLYQSLFPLYESPTEITDLYSANQDNMVEKK